MTSDSFFDLDIGTIIEGYRNQTLHPTKVADICIRQVQKLDPSLAAWVCFDPKYLMREADLSDNRITHGLPIRDLEGIPIGIKDIMNTKDFPTEMGSPIWHGFTPGNDARVVYNLSQNGAIIPGKTATAEFAVHTLAKTKNPHDFLLTPGTSSSGSAVAVASGMVLAAIGTQTAGSIIRPASFCGIYGCKPSFGLIPRTGILKTTDSLDTVGFFVLHLKDITRVFNAIRVHGPDYPISHAALSDKKKQVKNPDRPWRVGFTKTHVWDNAEEYAKDAIITWVDTISEDENIEISEVTLPEVTESAHKIHASIYNKTLAHYFSEEYKKKELVSSIMRELIEDGMHISADQFQDALVQQTEIARVIDTLFMDYDIIISLSTAGAAPRREQVEKPDPALLWNMAHLPVVSAPVFKSSDKLPFGAQITSRRYHDLLLFSFCDYLASQDYIPKTSNPSLQGMRFPS